MVKCCGEALWRSVVEKGCRDMLWRSVVEKGCRRSVVQGGEVLW